MIVIKKARKAEFNKSKTLKNIIDHVHQNMPEWKMFLDMPYADVFLIRSIEKETLKTMGSPWSTSTHKERKKYQLACVVHVLPEQEEVDPTAQSFWDTLHIPIYKVAELKLFKYDIQDMGKEYEF